MRWSDLDPYWQVVKRTFSPRAGPGTPWPLFAFSLRSILLSKKKTPLLFGFLLIPLLITLFITQHLEKYVSQEDATGATGGLAFFQDIMSQVFFPLLIPIVTAVYATSAIGEEVEGKTLPYLFTRPVYRSWTLLAKSLSFLVASTLLGILALTATFVAATELGGDAALDHLDQLFVYWSAVGLTVLATGGVFLFLGTISRHAAIFIVIYTFIWETVLSNLFPSDAQTYSFVWYERAYINSFIDRSAGFFAEALLETPSAAESVVTLLGAGLLGFLAALLVVSYKDYNV